MTSKQVVKDCIHFQGPAWLPVLYFNKDKEKSDLLLLDYHPAADLIPYRGGADEWGVVWEDFHDGTMGQPKHFPLIGTEQLPGHYRFPDPDAPGRFDGLTDIIAQNSHKYILGGLRLSGFTIMTSLLGFSQAMEDMYLQEAYFQELLEHVAAFENGVIRNYARLGADGIAFYDDWGSQRSLLIAPEMWRKFMKPVYKRQFELVHALGCDVYFHCCGQIRDIIDDLIELGVDVLNLNQPEIFPTSYLGKRYKGKICFNCPVDHQTVAISGNREEIHAYVRSLCEQLATSRGGFIGYIEEYSSVGMSAENYTSICDAFAAMRYAVYTKKLEPSDV